MVVETTAVEVKDKPCSMSAPVVVERHESFDEVADIQAEWDTCVEAVGGDVYATLAWCRTWWRFYGDGRRLALFLFRQNSRLVAIFPLFFETACLAGCPVKFVRLVGCDHSVTTCSPVIEPGLEATVLELLAEELVAERFRWDVLQLGPLPGYARRVAELESAVRRHFLGYRVDVRSAGCHTVIELPATYEEYLSRLSKNERREVRREHKFLETNHRVNSVFSKDLDSVARAFGRFTALHETLWQLQGKLGHFRDWPRAGEFHEALMSVLCPQGRVHVSELVVDDRVVACQYRFRFGKLVHWFLTARAVGPEWSKVNLGRALTVAEVRYDIGSGASLVDDLGGYYEYKLRLGGRLTEKRTILVLRQEAGARVRWRFFRSAAWALDKAYYRVWFARIGPKLGLLRGPLWRSWIRSRM